MALNWPTISALVSRPARGPDLEGRLAAAAPMRALTAARAMAVVTKYRPTGLRSVATFFNAS
jgi:hypothetical protein